MSPEELKKFIVMRDSALELAKVVSEFIDKEQSVYIHGRLLGYFVPATAYDKLTEQLKKITQTLSEVLGEESEPAY